MKSIVPLGDAAALIYFATEAEALAFVPMVRRHAPSWLQDVYAAYSSVAVCFDLLETSFAAVAEQLETWIARPANGEPVLASRRHQIPCCYEYQLDLPRIVEFTGMSGEETIALHYGTEYTVYAIGFCPGFPYLGHLPAALANVPRLTSPRLRVEAGSIGLTGRQTGIYTEPRPGGWNLIGRTPLELVNVADGYFPLQAGDKVRFTRIDEMEFGRLRGQRL